MGTGLRSLRWQSKNPNPERAVRYARAMSALTWRLLTASAGGILSLALSAIALAATVSVHVQHKPAVRQNVHLTFRAKQLPEGGYYYGVIVLKPYKKYTRASPPPCSTFEQHATHRLRLSAGQRTGGACPYSGENLDRTLVPERLLRRRDLCRPSCAALRKRLPLP